MIACLWFATGHAWALGDQWYLGIGGGASWLQPNPEIPGIDLDERLGQSATFFVGTDLDNRSSVQLQAYSFGEAEFDTPDTADYFGADASIVYRLFDSRDRARAGTVFGASLYGRFGLGYAQRDSELELSNDTPVYFGAGGGLEVYLHRNIALRAEAFYHDSDLASASLNLVTRFGGRGRPKLPDPPELPTATLDDTPDNDPDSNSDSTTNTGTDIGTGTLTDTNTNTNTNTNTDTDTTATLPSTTTAAESDTSSVPVAPTESETTATSVAEAPTTPETPVAPTTSEPAVPAGTGTAGTNTDATDTGNKQRLASLDDRDGDGIENASDICPRSAPGYPVRDNGCALFDGVLSGVQFADGGDELLPGAFEQLDFLVRVLGEYPQSRIELLAHTDDAGTVRDQSILTRARLKSVGTYLVRKGIRANRLVLRSFGGTRPLYDNRADEGRRGNNRIEVIENTN